MAVWDDLEAVEANESLSPEQKKSERARRKCEALSAALRNPAVLNTPYSFDGVTYVLRSVRALHENGGLVLRLVVSAWNTSTGALLLSSDDVHVIINPPIFPESGLKDLVQVGKEILRNLLPRVN
jgi:hypothetical protein